MRNILLITGTAILSSMCCITPLVAILAGSSSISSTFSVFDPFRPYLITLTIITLGIAWYQVLKPAKDVDCECETSDSPSVGENISQFLKTRKFMAIVTVLAALMLTFPYYAESFYPETQLADKGKSTHESGFEIKISGMTCGGCEKHIEQEISKLPGITKLEVSYENGNALVNFDRDQTSIEAVEAAVKKTGYQINSSNKLK